MTTTSDDRAVLLLSDDLSMKIVMLWPSLRTMLKELRGSPHDLMSYVATKLGEPPDRVTSRVTSLISLGVVHMNGTVDRSAENFIERLSNAKLAGLSAFDPERVAVKFLMSMELDERMEWLEKVGGLE